MSNRNGELINIEGDPDHPVNLGGLCPKGATLWGLRQVVTADRKVKPNPNRFLYPMVRRPGSKEWERISWDEAFDGIARHVKKTRDETFVQTEDGYTVNRTGSCRSSAVRSAPSRLTTRRVFATRQRFRVSRRRLAAVQ